MAIEDIAVEQLSKLINYVLSKMIKPDITIENVRELNEEAISRLKRMYGIEGIVLDVDDTLRKDMGRIPKCNKDWLEKLKDQLKVIVVSNGKDNEIEKYLSENGIEYIGNAFKPLKRNFLKACEKMSVRPEEVLVVGNSLFDDIYGGNRSKMNTALVKRVEEERE